jgi:MOSC domain
MRLAPFVIYQVADRSSRPVIPAGRRSARLGAMALDDSIDFRGRLDHIHRCPTASAAMQPLDACAAVAGIGLDADRYARRTGTYSSRHHIDRQVTLIESEVLAALARDHGVTLEPHEHRRNLTTRGVALAHLVGCYFRVGECVLYGGRLNVPCTYLEQLLGRRVFRPLIHRSGLNARIIVGGMLRVGDVIEPVAASEVDPVLRAANEAVGYEAPPEVG